MKLVDCKSARNPTVVYTADHSKAVVRLLFLLCVALWFILQGDLYCVFLSFCFSVLLALRLPRLGKRELVCVHFVRLFVLRLLVYVPFLFLLVSGIGCDL